MLTGDIILAEVLQGFTSDRAFNVALRLMGSLDQIDIGGRDVAIQAARNFQTLRGKRITVRKTIDTLIATRCIEDGLSLRSAERRGGKEGVSTCRAGGSPDN